MNRWQRGETEIEHLLAAGELQRVKGPAADGTLWLDRAAATLDSAAALAASNPNSAYTLAYDAARFACAGLLAQQGLRATTTGGHLAIQRAAIAQFGTVFDRFAVMRRRRNELEYPEYPDETVETAEASDAIASARVIIDAARALVGHLGLF